MRLSFVGRFGTWFFLSTRRRLSTGVGVTMYTSLLLALFTSAKAVFAACSGPLVIDDFSKWSSNSNSLNDWVSGMF